MTLRRWLSACLTWRPGSIGACGRSEPGGQPTRARLTPRPPSLPFRALPMPAVEASADVLAPTTTRAEEAYLGVVRRVLETGTRKVNRTGTDTIASFAEHYVVDLAEGYPLLT